MAALDEYVTGHEEAKKALVVMLHRSDIRCIQKYDKLVAKEHLIAPLKILLIGSSGTGKTHLVSCLSDLLYRPVIKLDATALAPTSARGGTSPEDLQKEIKEEALRYAKMFPELYEYVECAIDKTIVYVDEIDKLGNSFDSSGSWNSHVQSSFLTTFDNKEEFAGVSFVFSGAFSSVTKEEAKKNVLGFTSDGIEDTKKSLDERILQAGIIPELLGRMNAVIELDRFGKDDFVQIIKERLLPKKQRDLAIYGMFDINMSEQEIEDLAIRASKSGLGVRFAQREIDRIFLEAEYRAGEDRYSQVLYLQEP
jgi:ATP-dependent protease Clp ATPase subunit